MKKTIREQAEGTHKEGGGGGGSEKAVKYSKYELCLEIGICGRLESNRKCANYTLKIAVLVKKAVTLNRHGAPLNLRAGSGPRGRCISYALSQARSRDVMKACLGDAKMGHGKGTFLKSMVPRAVRSPSQ